MERSTYLVRLLSAATDLNASGALGADARDTFDALKAELVALGVQHLDLLDRASYEP
jgi:hypothetical protein